MIFTSKVLIFVVTLMLLINHSYLITTIVELPDIDHKTFEDYKNAVTNTNAMQYLNEVQFDITINNYNDTINNIINTNSRYEHLRQEINIVLAEDQETRLLKRIMSFEGCDDSLKHNINVYIETRKKYYSQTNLQKINKIVIESGFPKIEEFSKSKEEIEYLQSLIPLSNKDGRIKNLYLNTLYGNNQHIIHKATDTFKSMWLYLLKRLDPIFGESYMSYFLRIMQRNKMPLPKELITQFYGDKKFKLFDEFDIWPELNGAFIMYYLFNCPLENISRYDVSHEAND